MDKKCVYTVKVAKWLGHNVKKKATEKPAKEKPVKEKKATAVKSSAKAALKQFYLDVVVPQLMKEQGYQNIMEVPRIEKITLNMGVGEAVNDKKILLEHAVKDMTMISGQKPQVTLTKKSIAGFKIRDGWPIGCKVTLRRERMYDFLQRLLTIAIPRVRDFRGLNRRAFDGRGNYNFGVKEQIIFPEIQYDKIDALRGLDICITTTAKNNAEGMALLKAFKFPFREAN